MPSSTTTSDTGPPERARAGCSRSRTRRYPCTARAPATGRIASVRVSSDELEHGGAHGLRELGRRQRIAVADLAHHDRRAEVHAPRGEGQTDRSTGSDPHRDDRVAARGDEQLRRRDTTTRAPPGHAEREGREVAGAQQRAEVTR